MKSMNNEEQKTIIIGGQKFSTRCPENCPGKKEPFMQGGLCHRCPIFNCVEREGLRLLRPEDYRPDWAKEWKRWFDEGMKGLPELYL